MHELTAQTARNIANAEFDKTLIIVFDLISKAAKVPKYEVVIKDSVLLQSKVPRLEELGYTVEYSRYTFEYTVSW